MRELGPYPIRMNKRVWTIPLCEVVDDKIKRTGIHLFSYDSRNPNGIGDGRLHLADTPVIDKTSFKLNINFPLSHPVIANISMNDSDTTLKNILKAIKYLYAYIYQEEENTASEQTYNIIFPCDLCFNKKAIEFLDEKIITHLIEDECPICRNYYEPDEKMVTTRCSHTYHMSCLNQWLTCSNTCPMCREKIVDCFLCEGNRFIESTYTGVVIPRSMRGVSLHRNPTDGDFGIHSFDYEDLILTDITYNRISNLMTIQIDNLMT